jgi:hypothetical protein
VDVKVTVEHAALDPFRGYAVRHEARVIRVGGRTHRRVVAAVR